MKRKNVYAALLAAALMVSLSGCDIAQDIYDRNKAKQNPPEVTQAPSTPEPEPTEVPYVIAPEYEEISFEQFAGSIFDFSSGVGGWNTTFTVTGDGYFGGQYHDSEMGSSGPDFPNGTLYMCNFYGQFSQPEKVDDYTWLTTVRSISYYQQPGTEEIIDGVLYSYASCYGLNEGDSLLIYVPGAPLRELPDDFLSWIGYRDKLTMTATKLERFGIFNQNERIGFSSYEYHDPATEVITAAEANYKDLQLQLEAEDLTVEEKEELSQKLFDIWDGVLNDLWNQLTRTMSEDTMKRITAEEISWIHVKEAAVKEAVDSVEDESYVSIAELTTSAEYTRDRVYELYAIIQNG